MTSLLDNYSGGLGRFLRRTYPLALVGSDVAGFLPAFFFAGLLRNEIGSVALAWSRIGLVACIAVLSFLVAGWPLHVYRNRYQVATFEEVLFTGGAWLLGGSIASFINVTLLTPRVPISIVSLALLLAGSWMIFARVLWRLARRASMRPDPEGRKRVLVFGAGDGGAQVVKSMLGDANSRFVPIGLLDDDPKKQNRAIEGVRVLGTSADIRALSKRTDTLLIAVPSASKALITRLANEAAEVDLDVMLLPSTTELFGMMADIDHARPLEITDLLGRNEVEVDAEAVGAYLGGKVVLVTGAGGSIGSELCRQILRYEPKELVMVDRDETGLQGVQLATYGHGLLDDDRIVLADIRDADRVLEVFEQHRPSIVFHAAALKHLPLLEAHPREGLLTNVFGTRNVLEAARSVGATHFVNISTDKAANPTSVLGTTKRLAEALTLRIGRSAPGEYISVRFGNVIGSRGSVLPLFEKQIAAGGPVTVTHPEVTRYFMSIPEASRLVLQAAAFGTTGETLVLDMGEPMKIVDLAKQLLKHYDSDAEIVFTGLRPNEKMHEVLGHAGEVVRVGPHPRIWHADAGEVLTKDDPVSLLDVEADELPGELLRWCTTAEVAAGLEEPQVPELPISSQANVRS